MNDAVHYQEALCGRDLLLEVWVWLRVPPRGGNSASRGETAVRARWLFRKDTCDGIQGPSG